jgi:hypothetical protein
MAEKNGSWSNECQCLYKAGAEVPSRVAMAEKNGN